MAKVGSRGPTKKQSLRHQLSLFVDINFELPHSRVSELGQVNDANTPKTKQKRSRNKSRKEVLILVFLSIAQTFSIALICTRLICDRLHFRVKHALR